MERERATRVDAVPVRRLILLPHLGQLRNCNGNSVAILCESCFHAVDLFAGETSDDLQDWQLWLARNPMSHVWNTSLSSVLNLAVHKWLRFCMR